MTIKNGDLPAMSEKANELISKEQFSLSRGEQLRVAHLMTTENLSVSEAVTAVVLERTK